jgi:hypothetical protein
MLQIKLPMNSTNVSSEKQKPGVCRNLQEFVGNCRNL